MPGMYPPYFRRLSDWSIGLNYWWDAHNANIKAAYSRLSPTGSTNQNEFTIQLQVFYF